MWPAGYGAAIPRCAPIVGGSVCPWAGGLTDCPNAVIVPGECSGRPGGADCPKGGRAELGPTVGGSVCPRGGIGGIGGIVRPVGAGGGGGAFGRIWPVGGGGAFGRIWPVGGGGTFGRIWPVAVELAIGEAPIVGGIVWPRAGGAGRGGVWSGLPGPSGFGTAASGVAGVAFPKPGGGPMDRGGIARAGSGGVGASARLPTKGPGLGAAGPRASLWPEPAGPNASTLGGGGGASDGGLDGDDWGSADAADSCRAAAPALGSVNSGCGLGSVSGITSGALCGRRTEPKSSSSAGEERRTTASSAGVSFFLRRCSCASLR